MKVRNWREKCKDRRLWNKIVKQANPPRVVAPIEEEEEEEEEDDDDDDDDDDEGSVSFDGSPTGIYAVLLCFM